MNQAKNETINIKKKTLQIYIVTLTICTLLLIVRIGLSSRLPAIIMATSIHDDAWCAMRAMYMLDGQWMGPYDQYTLIKSVFAPLLMAFSKVVGFTYMELCTYLYCISCVIFIIALSPVIQRWYLRIGIFSILLFNPITYSASTFQRVYRNGLSQWQLLLIFGGIIALFIRRKDSWKAQLPWALLTGFSLWAFFNTREDGIWLYPFIIVSTGVLLVSNYLENHKKLSAKMMIYFIPIIMLVIGNMGISMINWKVYGVALGNDRDDGYYADVVKDLYMIAPDPEDDALYSSEEYKDQYYNVYTSTIEKAYEVSPTFKTVKTEVNQSIQKWDLTSGIKGDGQPWADHILFAIRDGVAAAGYYKDLYETEAFYKKVHEELQNAFDTGLLEKKKAISLTAMAAPFEMEDLSNIFMQIPKTISYIISFKDVSASASPGTGTENRFYAMEELTGDRGILGTKDSLKVSGWSFLFSDEAEMAGAIYDLNGKKLVDLLFSGGEDVYNYYKDNGLDYAAAKTSRFTVAVPGYTTAEGLVLRTWDINNPENAMECVLSNILSKKDGTSGSIGFEHGRISIDQAVHSIGTERMQIEEYTFAVKRANGMINVYQKVNCIVTLLGVLGYIFLCIKLFLSKKQPNQMLLAVVLLLTGLLFSFIVFVGALSYMTVTTFYAQNSSYLSSAYIIMLAFSSVAIAYFIEGIVNKFVMKEERV